MPNMDNRDLVLRDGEDDTVIANSKSKISLPLPGEHFHPGRIPARRISLHPELPQDVIMRDDFSCTEFFACPCDSGRVTIGDWLVVRWCRQSCTVGWADGQVFQKALSGGKLLFGNSVNELMEGVAAHSRS